MINGVEGRTDVQEDKYRHFPSDDGANKVIVSELFQSNGMVGMLTAELAESCK